MSLPPTLSRLLPPPRARFWRDRALRPAAQLIDLDTVRANGVEAKRKQGVAPFFAVVKANGYGLGAVPVARALDGVADGFAVATLEEGLELRRAGITAPVLLLSGCFPAQLPRLLEADLTLGLISLELLQEAAAFAQAHASAERPLRAQLKFDSGMGRLGLPPDQAGLAREVIAACAALRVEGLYSHLAAGEAPEGPLTRAQRESFAVLAARFPELPATHLANSDAIRTGAAPGRGARAGLALGRGLAGGAAHSAVALVAYPLLSKTLPAGHAVGYGPDRILAHETRVAVLPVGYADGIPRAIAPRAWAHGAGERLPLLGRISMDLTTLRFPDHASLESPVWLLGGDGPTVDDWAGWAGMIPYEILTGLDGRLLKIYFRGGMPAELRMPRGGYEPVTPAEWES